MKRITKILSFILAIIVHIIGILASMLIFKKEDVQKYRIDVFASVYSNCGFMAIPLLSASLGSDGVFSKPGSFHQPADGITDGQTDGDPCLADAGGIDGGGQTHQHPRAHVRGAGGQGGHPGAHLAATQEVGLIAAVLGTDKEINTDAQHEHQINNKYDRLSIKSHDSLSYGLRQRSAALLK